MIRLPYVPRWTNWIFPQMEWQTGRREIALTFDDGPHPEITPWVLNELAKRNMVATFFCVGENVQRNNAVFADLLNSGNAVGNHTHQHLRGTEVGVEEYIRDVEAATEFISTKLFRPPYGRIAKSQVEKLVAQNYRIIMWEVLSYDFDANLSPDYCFKILSRYTREGSIVVFHDSEKAWPRLKSCLPKYLDWLVQNNHLTTLI